MKFVHDDDDDDSANHAILFQIHAIADILSQSNIHVTKNDDD